MALGSHQNVCGQASHTLPRVSVKANFLSLLNPFKTSWQLSTDIRVAKRSSIDLGIGTYFASQSFAQFVGETYTGPRVRLGYKYFLEADEKKGIYLGLQSKYSQVRNKQYKNLTRQGGQYFESLLVTRTVSSSGIAFQTGLQWYMGKRRQLFMDFQGNIGAILHDVHRTLPPDAELLDGNPFSFELTPGKYRRPDLYFGLHLGYCFW